MIETIASFVVIADSWNVLFVLLQIRNVILASSLESDGTHLQQLGLQECWK
jgi:hypothetical protein